MIEYHIGFDHCSGGVARQLPTFCSFLQFGRSLRSILCTGGQCAVGGGRFACSKKIGAVKKKVLTHVYFMEVIFGFILYTKLLYFVGGFKK